MKISLKKPFALFKPKEGANQLDAAPKDPPAYNIHWDVPPLEDKIVPYKQAKKDELVTSGPTVHKGFAKWSKREHDQWQKAVAQEKSQKAKTQKEKNLKDFDTWVSAKYKKEEEDRIRAERLQRQYARELREYNSGARTAFSPEVQHLIPISYYPVF